MNFVIETLSSVFVRLYKAERGRERQRERETERDRQRERQRETERQRQRERDTERHRETQRDRERATHRQAAPVSTAVHPLHVQHGSEQPDVLVNASERLHALKQLTHTHTQRTHTERTHNHRRLHLALQTIHLMEQQTISPIGSNPFETATQCRSACRLSMCLSS